ncbi:succinate dehydrogenase assembly factor 2 [Tabrizicola sp.]|jgi:antitoxin CptB|uniref:FAD assembly factor SdhE n=1 Tax=Tabrizicola sp. TaxID=2005166 RepID=UPI000BCEF182|nr:succinate dehydrogenase assembly factor 2 [Tabrizicola sp.]MBY0352720.1 succinate dehydrogenase assembly factor 2 [Tabrizicola sp.]OYX18145.1 MAG: succinate dehydrogenase assembly factor 2 [Rhodobacterales bacterium 32-66-9]
MQETAEARLKRMRMRSWRRGTKEMDLVLGPFADAHLADLTAAELAEYEALLAENDQDLMAWILGQTAPPAGLARLLARVSRFAQTRLGAGK